MKEIIYKTEIADIKLEAIVYDEAFHIERADGINGIMSQINKIHQHSTFEVFMILHGSLHIANEREGQDYANCIVIIPPYYNHYTQSNEMNGYGFYISIKPGSRESTELFSSVEAKLSKKITAFDLDEGTDFYARRFADSVEKEASKENIIHLLSLLFSSLFEQMNTPANPKKRSGKQSKYRNYIHDIDQYLSNNINSKFTLQDLADELYLCPKQVSRIIKKQYNCSFPELINKKRLTIACMLLKQTNLSVKQIAATVGYEYENYFFKLFKEHYSVNPTQYRKDTANQNHPINTP